MVMEAHGGGWGRAARQVLDTIAKHVAASGHEQSEAATKKVKTDAAPRMKMLRAALASSSSNKDEV